MLINEVENIVGLSKKSIRYYEENGLLSPRRNESNDYRVYDEEDIIKLRKLKFLRELNVSIRELKLLDNGELTLSDCIRGRIAQIENEEEAYQRIKKMCLKIIETEVSYEKLDIKEYFQEINILNKEGFTLRDVKTSKKRKIVECVISSVVFGMLFLFLGGIISYFQFTEIDKMPWVLYWFCMMIFIFPIIGIEYNLVGRIKEINGGEEDEASKY